MGVAPANIERFKSNLVELHKEAIAAGEPLTKLIADRVAYDKQMRSALGEQNYALYRDYEESKPAVREYQMLQEYATTERKLVIDAGYADKLIQLIKDAGATTTETWHGPYDPIPRPAVGKEMVGNRMSQELANLKEQSRVLLESARQANIPDELVQVLTEYYSQKVEQREKGLAFISRPTDEIEKDLRARSDEKIARAEQQFRQSQMQRSQTRRAQ